MEQLHERLTRIRKAKGLTRKAVAQALGEAESTYRGWESGRGWRLPPLDKLSQILSISVTELLVGQKPEAAELIETLAKVEEELRQLRLKISSRS